MTDRGVPVRWPSNCVTMVVHVDRPPLDLTPAGVEATARAAAATWSRPAVGCTGFEVQMAIEQTDDAVVANDARNNLVFRRDSWAYDPQALAITTVFARQSDGVIVDGDLELNAVTFVWGDLAAGASGARTWDLQNTLTHELGHLLGLDHNCRFPGDVRALLDDRGAPVPECASAPPEIRESTMYPAVLPGDLERRTLAADDIAAVCGIYPLLGAGPCLPAADGGAQLGDAGVERDGGEPSLGDAVTGGDRAGPDAAVAGVTGADAAMDVAALSRGCACRAGGRAGRQRGCLLMVVLALGLLRRRPRPV
jgi:hypothetical protein